MICYLNGALTVDQVTFQGLLHDAEGAIAAANGLLDLTITAGNFDAPIVVLIHGIGGTAQHWTDPVRIPIDDTWLFDLASPPPAPASGLCLSPPYAEGSVTPWTRLLNGRGMTTVAWSQARPNDQIEYAVSEAKSLFGALEARLFAPYSQDVGENGAVPRLVLLCHSRGGLVARAALKDLGAASVPHLRTVITLCTPHTGSYMPQVADDYNSGLGNQIDVRGLTAALPGFLAAQFVPLLGEIADQVRLGLLHRFGPVALGPGYDELLPGSAMLTALVQGEAPLPGVRYVSFGGSNPSFIRLYLCQAGQHIALPDVSPFLVAELSHLPDIGTRYGGLAELSQGDSSVALSRSPWPAIFGAGDKHQVVYINHMQALVSPALQQAVMALLAS